MATDLHREEVLLVLLANARIALDAESVAATYHTSIGEWRASLERLERKGFVERVGDGLYVLTAKGEQQVAVRGAGPGPAPVGEGIGVE